MTWLIILVLVVVVIFAKNPGLRAKLMAGSGSGLTDPRILIAAGIIVFDLVIWAMIPWLWAILTHDKKVFVLLNVGIWTVLYLRTIKTKDSTGKESPNQTALTLASIVSAMLVLGLLTTAKDFGDKKGWFEKGGTGDDKSVVVITAPAAGVGDSWSKALQIPQGKSFESRSLGHLVQSSEGEIVAFDPARPTCFEGGENANPCFKKNLTWVKFQAKGVQPVGVTVKFLPYRPVPR